MSKHNFKELKVWEKSRVLVKEVHIASKLMPADEKYALIQQIKRSAISIPSNIAEGAGRNSDKDFIRFLNISLGSSYELETQLLLAYDLGYLTEEQTTKITTSIEVQKMLIGFLSTLKAKLKQKPEV